MTVPRKPPVRHMLGGWLPGRRYGWPLVPTAGRRGASPLRADRLTEDPEEVTCLHCLDALTRPA